MTEKKASLRKKLQFAWQKVKKRSSKEYLFTEHLIFCPEFQNAKNILLYSSIYPEVDTFKIRDMAWKLKKTLYFPYCDNNDLTIWRIVSMSEMEPTGYKGIQQPSALTRSKDHREGFLHDMDLVIVPGLGFDLEGRRIGRGKGYYDRFLSQRGSIKKPLFMGISFEELIQPAPLPVEEHDVRMDLLLTETGVKHLNNNQ